MEKTKLRVRDASYVVAAGGDMHEGDDWMEMGMLSEGFCSPVAKQRLENGENDLLC